MQRVAPAEAESLHAMDHALLLWGRPLHRCGETRSAMLTRSPREARLGPDGDLIRIWRRSP